MTIRPEFAFVVEATRWNGGPIATDRLGELCGQVDDWDKVLALIDRHWVAGLCNANVEQLSAPLPDGFRSALALRAISDSSYELTLLGETIRLSSRFEACGIDCRVVKGIATARSIFGRFGVRYSTDIDFLISPDQLMDATRLLIDAGYELIDPPAIPEGDELKSRLARYKDFTFRDPRRGILIELHWRLFANRHTYPGAEGTATARMPVSDTVDIPVLQAEVAELYLCFHGAEHAWARLKWLADLAALLTSRPERGEAIFERSRAIGRQRMTGPGLWLCKEFYGLPVPDVLNQAMERDRRMRALVTIARDAVIGEQDGTELEARPFATTRKSISHYLMLNDPRHWLREMTYDFTHSDDPGAGAPIVRRLASVWRVLSSKARASP